MKEKARVKKRFNKKRQKAYRYQLGGRISLRTLPAAGIGLASGYAVNRLKKKIKKER